MGAEKGLGSDEKSGMVSDKDTNSDSIMLMLAFLLGQMGNSASWLQWQRVGQLQGVQANRTRIRWLGVSNLQL